MRRPPRGGRRTGARSMPPPRHRQAVAQQCSDLAGDTAVLQPDPHYRRRAVPVAVPRRSRRALTRVLTAEHAARFPSSTPTQSRHRLGCCTRLCRPTARCRDGRKSATRTHRRCTCCCRPSSTTTPAPREPLIPLRTVVQHEPNTASSRLSSAGAEAHPTAAANVLPRATRSGHVSTLLIGFHANSEIASSAARGWPSRELVCHTPPRRIAT